MSKLKANISYNFIYQFLMLCFPLIITPYISRAMGAEGIGIYSYHYSIAHYFVIFAALGLSNYGTRAVSSCVQEDKKEASKLFWEIYAVQLICSIAVSVVYLGYLFIDFSNKLPILIFGLYVLSAFFDITWFFFGRERFAVVLTRNLVIKIATTVCIFIFVKSPADVWVYSVIMLGGILLSQASLWFCLSKDICFTKISLKEAFKKHFWGNAKLFIPVIAVAVYKYMDKIMIGSMANKAQLGYYENVERLVNIPVAFVTALGTVMLSRMSNLYASEGEEKNEKGLEYIRNSVVFTLFISSLMIFGILAVIDEFVPIFFGAGFSPCVDLAYWMLPTTFFIGVSNVLRTQYLLPLKKDKIFIISVWLGAFVNLVCNLLLIPRYEAVGAAIGTFLAELAVVVFQYIAVRKEVNIDKELLVGVGFAAIAVGLLFAVAPITLGSNFWTLAVKLSVVGVGYLGLAGLYALCFKPYRGMLRGFLNRKK